MHDESKLARDVLTIAVQVSGKVRSQIEVPVDATEETEEPETPEERPAHRAPATRRAATPAKAKAGASTAEADEDVETESES